jgi:hypothetical protein
MQYLSKQQNIVFYEKVSMTHAENCDITDKEDDRKNSSGCDE